MKTVQQTEEEMLGPEATAPEQAESPRPSRGESDAEERRHAAEKKRKGKQIAPSKTKKAKGKSTESPLPLPTKVPYAAEPEDSAGSSESEEEQEEELNFEPTEIWITSKLLDEMRKFDDPETRNHPQGEECPGQGRDVCFYEVGQSEAQTKQEPEMVEAKDTADMEAGARIEVEEEGEALGAENVQEPVDVGLELIVDLTDVPEGTDSPINAREARRQARRSLLDEIDETVQQTEEEMLGPEATAPEQAESPRPSRGESDAEERRHAAEKKRKGKQIAPSKTKKAKGKSTESPLPLPTKVPYAAEPEDSAGSSESEEEQEEELNFEPTEIWITSKLLDEMRKFDDPETRNHPQGEECPGQVR
ncbi:eukaryotic translation initiation factor 5B-like [Salvia splendens]|uniref:eukaryotic translation initiation factor 5B-like n=1 Tax=Salvia splendens TaxID=180675 RepID=UPI001C2631A0|nr:eukaryotic translation initiation factor 5B-like [Salvia splendens]